jgi:hypothetical protein
LILTLSEDNTALAVSKLGPASRSLQGEAMLFPYGAATLAEVVNIVRSQCIEEEIGNLNMITSDWRQSSNHFQALIKNEPGLAETIGVQNIEESYLERLAEIASDLLFKQSFSLLPTEFKLVEIGKLVAPQRLVNLGYVERLRKLIPRVPGMKDLIDFCLQPKQTPPPPKSLQLAQNLFSFSSPSQDFRFLGGYQKILEEDDVKASTGGGLPVSALVLLLGYGSPTSNVYSIGNRMILNNGFHRMFALEDMGIEYAPVLVQKVGNSDLEFPEVVAGLPKDYLIEHQRPVLLKDFIDPKLVRTLRTKPRMMNVQIGWNFQQTFVPV